MNNVVRSGQINKVDLPLDRSQGTWSGWCLLQTPQTSRQCGRGSWGACAILSCWFGLCCRDTHTLTCQMKRQLCH